MDCSGLETLDHAEFAIRLTRERRLLRGTIEVTHRCNNACSHCYLDPAGVAPCADPPLDFLLEILDALVAEETLWLTLTGGDPLLRDDFAELYMHAKRRGFLVSIYTNARLVTEELADLFALYPPRLLSVSLYGATADTYDALSRIPGSFDEAMAGIRRLHARGIPAHLKSMAMRSTVHDLPAMHALAQELGWAFLFDPCLFTTLNGDKHVLAERLSPEEVVALEQSMPERARAWQDICHRDPPGPLGDRLLSCMAGRHGVVIDPLGNVHLCASDQRTFWPLGRHNVRDSLHRIFYEEFPRELARRATRPYTCGECELSYMCNACAPLRAREAGDELEPCLHACQLAQARNHAFGGTQSLPACVQEALRGGAGATDESI